MKRFIARLRKFFFPGAEAPRWQRILPYAILGLLTGFFLLGAAYGWEYTNSPEFCGTSCHTMPPEYTSYLTSPHARIDCVDCHIGEGFITTRITRKAGDIRHIVATTFQSYEFPIRAHQMRPARDTCELCHFPEKFSDDSLREIERFEDDKNNTPKSIYLTMKTGGGTEREGLGRGIHWHIQNPVLYLPTDPEEQDIPYVRVVDENGGTREYIDIESGFDPDQIDESELKQMDCITCHNRITHLVLPPEDTIDQLIARGQISTDIPDIRRQAIAAYSQIYDTTQMGLNAIAGIESYYSTYYPEFYAENGELVNDAIQVLQDAYAASVYPEQNSDWTTHPNNVGHKDSPGCFRCHDGKHLDSQEKAIRLECNICHSIPVVAGPNDFVANIEISRGPEPESHLDENWIGLHNQVYDATCENCHTVEDPGGTSDTSFCSNSACHGTVWDYAGFDAPALREVLSSQMQPTATPQPLPSEDGVTYAGSIGPLLTTRCAACHGDNAMKGLNLTTYQDLMNGGESGMVVIPGDPENSLILQKMTAEEPHFANLNADEIELLVEWILNGAPEN